MVYLLFILGFVLLIKGADWLIEGAAALAQKLGISELVIGLTIVSLGTSAPELVVNVLASLEDKPGLAIGNVVGSNLSNLMLILGVTAMVSPIAVQYSTRWIEIPFSMLSTALIMALVNDRLLDGMSVSILSRSDGIAIMAYFLVFMGYTIYLSRRSPELFQEEVKARPVWKSISLVIIGILSLSFGGDWIVDGAEKLALLAGLSEAVVGLTIVAIGTSLPELATTVAAARKKNADIAIGNVIGSNIFNLLWILGLSALIKPIPFRPSANYDFLFLIAITILLMVLFQLGKRNVITSAKGIFLTSLYVAYLIFTVLMNR